MNKKFNFFLNLGVGSGQPIGFGWVSSKKLSLCYPLYLIICWCCLFFTHPIRSSEIGTISAENLKNIKLPNSMGAGCCCGSSTELFYPNLDFEDAPIAPPGGWIDYSSGQSYGPWVVTSGSVSIHAPDHLNLGAGNPNGSSQHLDLHGFNQGAVRYPLSGLTAGYMYTIEFWYAVHSGAGSSTAILRVGGGSLLSVNWSASNPGNVVWLKASYMFTASGTSTTMEFTGTGNTPCCGMLIDDIRIFECPSDVEKPEILNAPQDLELDCINELPPVEPLLVQDNCDVNPMIVFDEKRNFKSPCELEIIRTWTVTDQCNNSTSVNQTITISDKVPPQFTNLPENKIVHCKPNIHLDFQNFLRNYANAKAIDNCSTVKFTYSYDTLGLRSCDSTLVDFIIEDDCGNSDMSFAWFIINDTIKPEIFSPSKDLIIPCGSPNTDSLISDWLRWNGHSHAGDNCSLRLGNKFLSKTNNRQTFEFLFYDLCGNVSKDTADIIQMDGSDTIYLSRFICGLNQEYSDTILHQNPGGCDSLTIVKYLPVNESKHQVLIQVCDSMDLFSDTLHLLNQYGCDSTVFVATELFPVITHSKTEYLCNSDSNYIDLIRHPAIPCDSFTIIQYVGVKTLPTEITTTTCDSLEAGIDSLIFKSRYGCDSLLIIKTVYSENEQTHLDSFVCGLKLEYTDTIFLQGRICDSLLIRHFKILPTDTSFFSRYSCNPADTGIFYQKEINGKGCDSIVIIEIEWSPSYNLFDTIEVCRIGDTAQLISKFMTVHGCDSVLYTYKKYLSPIPELISRSTCEIDSVRTDTLFLNGVVCDSIAIIQYIHTPVSDTLILQRTCFFDSVRIDTQYVTNRFGCDSLIVTRFFHQAVLFDAKITDISCAGNADGVIEFIFPHQADDKTKYFIDGIESGQKTKNLTAGQYSIYLQDEFGCLSETRIFNIHEPDSLMVDGGPDLSLGKNETINMNGFVNRNIQSVLWSPESYFNCPGCLSTLAKFDRDTLIQIEVIDSNGCKAIDFVRIKILLTKNVFAPNVISVNGDQVNDRFYLIGDEGFIINTLQIYDRWGNLVFSSPNMVINDPTTGWDGSFKNHKVIPGVYTYFAVLTDDNQQIIQLAGELTVIR
ncbi:MAG: gliding motility-associated C-terminal domain-containing protein [Saprospiraceae bacterium]|nr:gliding motility-associated C-terminal domain-containing protein [Saprospiraceae bacterium]